MRITDEKDGAVYDAIITNITVVKFGGKNNTITLPTAQFLASYIGYTSTVDDNSIEDGEIVPGAKRNKPMAPTALTDLPSTTTEQRKQVKIDVNTSPNPVRQAAIKSGAKPAITTPSMDDIKIINKNTKIDQKNHELDLQRKMLYLQNIDHQVFINILKRYCQPISNDLMQDRNAVTDLLNKLYGAVY